MALLTDDRMCDFEICDSNDCVKLVSNEKSSREKMVSSCGSTDTPTDSGVALSEDDLINSMISSTGGIEEVPENLQEALDSTLLLPLPQEEKNVLSKSDIENNNCSNNRVMAAADENNMMESMHSTFDTTEIVYRKKLKKLTKSAPKKRVSFHEDILNSTRTDNIHIEHGFITYKGRKAGARYSWCSEEQYNNEELDSFVDNGDEKGGRHHHVYRNACSEVLDYGQTELDDDECNGTQIGIEDKSGVFEYPQFYKCQCSSSSSIDSGSSSENNSKSSDSDQQNYPQTKSSSCDCIGSSDNIIQMNRSACFFSEPNIRKSVWNKERKPKSSCLKKSKTSSAGAAAAAAMPQQSEQPKCQKSSIDSNLMKKFNIHQITKKVIQDNNAGKMLIGSLKDILGISLPERGVPEGSEDPEECFPREKPIPAPRTMPPQPQQDMSFLQKVGFFRQNPSKSQTLSKSLDGGLGNQQKKFIHDVDNHLRRAHEDDSSSSSDSSSSRKNSLKNESSMEEKEADEDLTSSRTVLRNKFIINCESTVFEHTGTIEIPESTLLSASSSFEGLQFTRKRYSNAGTSSAANNSEAAGGQFDANGMTKTDSELNIASTISDMTSSIHSEFSCKSDTSARSLSSQIRSVRDRVNSKQSLLENTSDIPAMVKEDDANMVAGETDVIDSEDIVMVSHDDVKSDWSNSANNYYLKIPSIMTSSSSSAKNSLISRFLRNVTQKKILDATIKRNDFFQSKLKNERKVFGGDLYLKVKPKDESLIKSLNWEINSEIEMGLEFDDTQSTKDNRLSVCSASSFEFDTNEGIGELRTDLIQVRELRLLRDENETLMKAFKLFIGYSNEGEMSAVLVFLTDKTIYVVGHGRNKLSNRFVLPYAELDVILMGPMGNTVLLSNMARDMQQVLLTCGTQSAEKLISSLEMCSRRGGFSLPAVGALCLDHFAPLQTFVSNNSSVGRTDEWKYYSIVSIPAGILGSKDDEGSLGPMLQGFLMHRNVSHSGVIQKWSAGYFMLKACVLYLFHDSTQNIPSWAVSLPNECQGAKRCVSSDRPHCFEILLRSGSLQLAAPDEFVASDWLQSVIQASNNLDFQMKEKQKILGCTLIMTENHLVTLREDFSSPLRRVVTHQKPIIMPSPSKNAECSKENSDPNSQTPQQQHQRKMSNSTIPDTVSEMSSIASTLSSPSRGNRSFPPCTTKVTKQNKIVRKKQQFDEGSSNTNMSSFYGKNSGIEVLMCAAIEELTSVKTPSCENSWWCVLEFSCQEVRENFDDLVLLFSTSAEMQRFLSMLETLWHAKTNDKFPIGVSEDDDDDEYQRTKHCEKLFTELKNSWVPLLDQLPPQNFGLDDSNNCSTSSQ